MVFPVVMYGCESWTIKKAEQQRIDAFATQWTWVWVSSRSWWWTGKPGVLQSMRSQRVGQDWATELNWTDPLRRNQDPDPRLYYCFLTASPLSLHPLPSLISNCLNLSVGTWGRKFLEAEWSLFSANKKIAGLGRGSGERRGTQKDLCPGA